jgi:tRNA A37 threonylcarbamoyladenosine synthetase subunit TsaC/SUA5/YrdC
MSQNANFFTICLATIFLKIITSVLGRDLSKPVAICVADVSDVFEWGTVTVPLQLLARLLPGPVTLCFKKFPNLNPEFNPGMYSMVLFFPGPRFF